MGGGEEGDESSWGSFESLCEFFARRLNKIVFETRVVVRSLCEVGKSEMCRVRWMLCWFCAGCWGVPYLVEY